MQFSSPLADACNYPPPRIKALPSLRQFTREGLSRPLAENVACRWLTDHARSGLYLLANSIERKVVWAPAYHCPALVEPFWAADFKVHFYPVLADLTPDFGFLEQFVQPGDAVVGVRYFGFDCGILKLANFCREYSNLLIEDLAHAPFIKRLVGHAAVTSLIKFYPVQSGAELLVADDWPNTDCVASAYDNLPNVWLEKLHRVVIKIRHKLRLEYTQSSFRYFNLQKVSRNILSDDLAIIEHSAQQLIIDKRRANYQLLAGRLTCSALGVVLFRELADNTAPYVLPFLLHNAISFEVIRQQGIQIYRWEELANSNCETSQDYRHRLIQLPIHQDLTAQQLNFIIDVFTKNRDT